MDNSFDWDDAPIEIEAMIHAAGDYVRASDDLRPRVIETSRLQLGEQRAQRCLRHVAVFVALVVVFIPTGSNRHTASKIRGFDVRELVDAEMMYDRAESNVSRNVDFAWGMVEAFTELRRQQADILGVSL